MKSARIANNLFKFCVTKKPAITFSILRKADIEEATECVADAFVQGNPITKEMKITREEFKAFSSYICRSSANSGLSIIAREKFTQKLIGCRIVDDASDNHQDMPVLSEKFDPIFSLLQAGSEKLPAVDKSNKVAHFVTLAVKKEYEGQGIAKQLLALQLHYLSQLNYQYFTVELAHPFTHQILKSILENEIEHTHSIQYKDFIFQETRPFENVPGEVITCLNNINALKPELKKWAELQELSDSLRIEHKNTNRC